MMNIVWFKRDLRVTDHQALHHAVHRGPTVGLFIFEPEWFVSPEFSNLHLHFVTESLEDLKQDLRQKGIPLVIRTGSAVQVLSDLHRQYPIKNIFSHEETGLDWTYKRDIIVKSWCADRSIPWQEFRQFGVVRRLKTRDTWNHKRSQIIERPIIQVKGQSWFETEWKTEQIPHHLVENDKAFPLRQKGGRKEAVSYLRSFLTDRGENYFRSISSPKKAFTGCSRLSPYLCWGNISITEVHHSINKKRASLQDERSSWSWRNSLDQFESRLWWHCHFIQKLESEPEIEFQNFNRSFDGMRESDFDEMKFQAWCKGETGFPMIDACMRALHQHGWINFRMRAMLMSFACYQLWLHWKKPAEFLAKNFIDFEPGIHYSQTQMQSGVTGINSIRIYSPKKQVLDQDPQGDFIKKYIPELDKIPNSDLAEPHLMPPLLQLDCGFRPGIDYPLPIVDPEKSYEIAKQKIFDWKKKDEVQKLSKQVLLKHGSRKNKHFPQQNRQLDVFSGEE